MRVFLIGDTHFGHANILRFEPTARPFKDLREMHDTLIHNWNGVVGPEDVVYHLGDVIFGSQYTWLLSLLNGHKRLIMGNHDRMHVDIYKKYFEKVMGVGEIQRKDGVRAVLTHIPVHPNNLEFRYTHNIHGHMHSHKLDDPRYINVSCEQTNMTPVLLSDLIKEPYEVRRNVKS